MKTPNISSDAHLFAGAIVAGDVTVEEGAGLWYNTVVRAELAPVHIGARTNLQDGCVVHSDAGHPVHIGSDVTVGHACVVHGCTVGDATLIGMGSVLMNDARVGKNCIIGAGSLVTSGAEIPDGMLAMGRPAKPVRPLTEEETAGIYHSAEEYLGFLRAHAAQPEAEVHGG